MLQKQRLLPVFFNEKIVILCGKMQVARLPRPLCFDAASFSSAGHPNLVVWVPFWPSLIPLLASWVPLWAAMASLVASWVPLLAPGVPFLVRLGTLFSLYQGGRFDAASFSCVGHPDLASRVPLWASMVSVLGSWVDVWVVVVVVVVVSGSGCSCRVCIWL